MVGGLSLQFISYYRISPLRMTCTYCIFLIIYSPNYVRGFQTVCSKIILQKTTNLPRLKAGIIRQEIRENQQRAL